MLEEDTTDKKILLKKIVGQEGNRVPLSEFTVMTRILEMVKNRKLVVFSILELYALDVNSNI